jgi:hypothetical protein
MDWANPDRVRATNKTKANDDDITRRIDFSTGTSVPNNQGKVLKQNTLDT